MQLLNGNVVFTPTVCDAAMAEESGRKLAAHLDWDAVIRLVVKAGESSEKLRLPPSALWLLVRIGSRQRLSFYN